MSRKRHFRPQKRQDQDDEQIVPISDKALQFYVQTQLDTVVTLLDMTWELRSWIDRVADVAITVGPGERLRAYLVHHSAHDHLSGCSRVLRQVFDVFPNNPMQFDPDFDNFANLVWLVERGEDNGIKLVTWLEQNGRERVRQHMDFMRSQVDRGGRPRGRGDSRLDTLYRKALPLYEKMPGQWGQIASELWSYIETKVGQAEFMPSGEEKRKRLDEDESVVYDLWYYMSEDARREQLKKLWPIRANPR